MVDTRDVSVSMRVQLARLLAAVNTDGEAHDLRTLGRPPILDGLGGHWNFFVDSDASVMGGNAIEDLGGGRSHAGRDAPARRLPGGSDAMTLQASCGGHETPLLSEQW